MLSIFRRTSLWLIFLTFQTTLVFSAPFFIVTPDSSGLTITTTRPGHTYPIAGIKVNTAGQHLTQPGNECELFSNGYCLFSVSKTAPKHLSIINTSAVINVTLCLNGKGPVSCQKYNVTIKDKKYTVGGSVSGLNRSGLVLLNNGVDNLNVPAGATSFKFPTPISEGSSYLVTVGKQPIGEICTVTNGSGININGNVNNIAVVCSSDVYTIGGRVSNLVNPDLILQNNGSDNKLIISNGTFTFTQPVAFGSSYNVTVYRDPTGQVCSVENASGTFVTTDITNISVVCHRDRYTIGGTISGLTKPGLVLQNNGADPITIAPNATSFQFPRKVPYGGSYNVTIARQPQDETCSVKYYSGKNVQDNVTDIQVTCSVNTFPIGGTVSGLVGTGLVLRNNGDDDKPILVNGPYRFNQPVPQGGSYDVVIAVQPSGSYCTVNNASGTVNAPVNVDVICSDSPVPVQVTITGLNQSGLIIQNNGGDSQFPPAGAPSSSFTPVPVDTPYNVTIQQQPLGQTCTFTSPSSGTAIPPQVNVNMSCTVSHAYINENGLPSGNGLYLCSIDSVGSLNNCGFTPTLNPPSWFPTDVAFATFSGTEYAYVGDQNTQNIYKCKVDSVSGQLTLCAIQNISPFPIDVSSIATQTIQGSQYAYVVSDKVYVCNFNSNGDINVCYPALANNMPNPTSVTIQRFNGSNYAYITNNMGGASPSYVYRCKINAAGFLDPCNPTPVNSTLSSLNIPTGVAFTNINSTPYAYVPYAASPNNVLRYNLNANGNGTFVTTPPTSPITAYTGSGNNSSGPVEFATVSTILYAYIIEVSPPPGTSPLQRCEVNANGIFTSCISNPILSPVLVSASNITFK